MVWGVVLAVAGLGRSGQEKEVPVEVAQLYRQYPDAHFSALFRESLEAFGKAESAYRGGRYGEAKGVLDGFWGKHAAGTAEWGEGYRESYEATRRTGVNVGHPACFYALRMLTECVEWRTSGKKPAQGPMTATMTVVLVGKGRGVEPRTQGEMEAGKGVEKARGLDGRLLAEDHEVIRESTRLFTEYVKAATRGELEVKVDYVHLPKLEVPVSVTWDQRGHAGLAGPAWGAIWDAVPESQRRGTDWWWVLYPSAVPDGHADFATTEFVTGGDGERAGWVVAVLHRGRQVAGAEAAASGAGGLHEPGAAGVSAAVVPERVLPPPVSDLSGVWVGEDGARLV